MDYLIWGLVSAIAGIVIFSILNYFIKMGKAPKSAEQGIWNAVYFIQLKNYEKALALLSEVEAEYALTPEVMCDLCVQRASACKGLKRFDEAADAYNALLDALQNSNSKIKQNEEFLAEIKECYAACGREAEFEKWEAFFANLPEYVEFREATEKDLDRIEEIYGLIHDEEEAGRTNIGWQREIYPTRKTAAEALEKGTLFVAEAEGQIVAAAKIDQEQVDAYADAAWEHPVAPDEVMVLHTLVVDPTLKGKGYGSKFVLFYEEYALASGCPYLRMDTNERNAAARALYRKLDYTEVGIVSCKFNGIDVVRLVCLEKKL